VKNVKQTKMKVTIELSGIKCTIENEEAEDIHEAFELIFLALCGVGFSEKVIKEGIKEREWE